MIAPIRIIAALKAVEPRHWIGLGVSVALHLGVLLGWKSDPPPEPPTISFEIVLESPDAKAPPAVKTKAVTKKTAPKKLAKQRQDKDRLESRVIDATWRGESKASTDAPALALPDASALGLAASLQATDQAMAKADGKPRLELAARAAANDGGAGLSEPGLAHTGGDSATRGETGVALAASSVLATSQELNPGVGAQAIAAASLAGASAAVGERQGDLHASASPQAALDVPSAGGAPAAAAATSLAVAAAGEAPGLRLAASGTLSGLAALPASAGSITDGPSEAALARGEQQPATPGLTVPAGGSEGGLARSQIAAPTARIAARRVAAGLERAGQGGATVALAPGEPGGSPRFAVALQPVWASAPGAKPGRASTSSRAVANGEPVSAGASRAVASNGGGEIATPGRTAASILAAAGEAGHAPVVLRATHVAPVKVVRPDSEIQRLDVLAPSNYCPLPLPGHNQPDNRAPPPEPNSARKPAYASDNPRIDYPVLANIRGVEGRVTVRVEVLASGRPGKMWLKQSSGSGLLDQDAQAQLARWRFEPARKNGQPVSAWIDVPVMYRLSEVRQADRLEN